MTKEPWGANTPWKNSVAFFTYLRGCLRKSWSNNPIKHNLIKKKRYQITNPNPKGKKQTVFGFCCELCDNEYPLSMGQVDHINPTGSLRKTEDIQGFVERLLYVTEDDLRLICKECNSALAMSEKQGISFQEAIILKKVIALEKAKGVQSFLEANGVEAAGNAKLRRNQAVELLTKMEKPYEPNN